MRHEGCCDLLVPKSRVCAIQLHHLLHKCTHGHSKGIVGTFGSCSGTLCRAQLCAAAGSTYAFGLSDVSCNMGYMPGKLIQEHLSILSHCLGIDSCANHWLPSSSTKQFNNKKYCIGSIWSSSALAIPAMPGETCLHTLCLSYQMLQLHAGHIRMQYSCRDYCAELLTSHTPNKCL